MGHRGAGVVIERVGGEVELRTEHLHVVVEHRHLGLRVVLAPVGSEGGVAIDHLSALEEIGVVVETVEVEAVGIERGLLMLQDDIITGTGDLLIAIVIGVVAEE